MCPGNNFLRSRGFCYHLSEHSGEFYNFGLNIPNSPSQLLFPIKVTILVNFLLCNFYIKHITQLPLALSLRTWKASAWVHNGLEAKVWRVAVIWEREKAGQYRIKVIFCYWNSYPWKCREPMPIHGKECPVPLFFSIKGHNICSIIYTSYKALWKALVYKSK